MVMHKEYKVVIKLPEETLTFWYDTLMFAEDKKNKWERMLGKDLVDVTIIHMEEKKDV